jgi:ribonuclease P protein component
VFEGNEVAQLQSGFGVSTRLFKKAVQRNRVKRLMKEAYRIKKNEVAELLRNYDLRLSLFLLYTGKELPDHAQVEKKMQLILERVRNIINEKAALHP